MPKHARASRALKVENGASAKVRDFVRRAEENALVEGQLSLLGCIPAPGLGGVCLRYVGYFPRGMNDVLRLFPCGSVDLVALARVFPDIREGAVLTEEPGCLRVKVACTRTRQLVPDPTVHETDGWANDDERARIRDAVLAGPLKVGAVSVRGCEAHATLVYITPKKQKGDEVGQLQETESRERRLTCRRSLRWLVQARDLAHAVVYPSSASRVDLQGMSKAPVSLVVAADDQGVARLTVVCPDEGAARAFTASLVPRPTQSTHHQDLSRVTSAVGFV